MLEYKLIRSNRKTLSMEVMRDGSILVRAPLFCTKSEIERILLKYQNRLLRQRAEMLSKPPAKTITRSELDRMKKVAAARILPRLQSLSEITGLTYEGVKITSARGRFGSCSGKNHLCFSVFLMLVSDEELDYVILHELCHTVHHNHSPMFYALVARFMPDWKNRQNRLKKIEIPQVVG